MFHIHITSDKLTPEELQEWASKNLYHCASYKCPDLCATCAFDRSCHNPNMTFGRPTNTTESLKDNLVEHCAKSRCNDKSSTYDCTFMVNGTCQFDYHCPADLTGEVGTQNE